MPQSAKQKPLLRAGLSPRGEEVSTLIGEALALCVLPRLTPRASISHSFPFLREALCCAAISTNNILRVSGLNLTGNGENAT